MGIGSRSLILAVLLAATTAAHAGAEQLAVTCPEAALKPAGDDPLPAFLRERATPAESGSDRRRIAFRGTDPPEALHRATQHCSRRALSDDDKPVIAVHLSGKFTERLLSPMGAVVTALLDAQKETGRKFEDVTLSLHSRGGDMNVAEALGSGLFRMDLHLTTAVNRDDLCISACVLLLAAGDERNIEGKVGIHRMYFRQGSPLTGNEAIYDKALQNLRQYFDKVGIDPTIVDAMLDVESDDVHYLTKDELARYGFAGRGD